MNVLDSTTLPFQTMPGAICLSSRKEPLPSTNYSSALVGHHAELLFQTAMVSHGYNLSRPTNDAISRYDFIVDDGVELYRVQVKTLRRRKNGRYELKLRSTGRHDAVVYSTADCDYVVGVDIKTGLLIWVRASDIDGRSSMMVGYYE